MKKTLTGIAEKDWHKYFRAVKVPFLGSPKYRIKMVCVPDIITEKIKPKDRKGLVKLEITITEKHRYA